MGTDSDTRLDCGGQGHTPGPWTANGRFVMARGASDTLGCAVSAPIAEATDTSFADVEGRHWATAGTPEANAMFIAHAVNCHDELLAALEGAIGALEQDVEIGADYNDSDWSGIANERLAAAKAAIAKARGQSPLPLDPSLSNKNEGGAS